MVAIPTQRLVSGIPGIHVQFLRCTVRDVLMSFLVLFFPSLWEVLNSEQYDTPRTWVAESQMGSWEGTRTEFQSGWRLDSAPPRSSPLLFFSSPYPAWPFNPAVPPLLTYSLCPMFIQTHPRPSIYPLFSLCLFVRRNYLYVCHGGCNMWPGEHCGYPFVYQLSELSLISTSC